MATPAHGYVRTRTDRGAAVRWPNPCVTMIAHAGTPLPVAASAFVAAARDAAAAWSRPAVACTDLELHVVDAATSDAPSANDGVNNVVFRTATWAYDPSALAITTVFARQDSGVILDADLELNAARFKWGDLVAGGAPSGAADLQNTLTHELGHLLGLDHNCLLVGGFGARPVDHLGAPVPDCTQATAEMRESTMFPATVRGDVERRTLGPDDVAGVCAIYPVIGAPPCADGVSDAGAPAGDAADDGAGDGGVEAAAPDLAPDATVAQVAQPGGCSCAAGGPVTGVGMAPILIVGLLGVSRRARRSGGRPRPASRGG